MLTVTNGDLSLPLLESNYEKIEGLNGETFQITFSSFSFRENIGHDLIDFNVTITDEDEHQYKIKNLTSTPSAKSVLATHIFYELVGHRKYDSFTGFRSFDEFADWLFSGTGWTYENAEIKESLNINTFGNNNFLQLLQRLIIRFDCEFAIMPKKVIKFVRRVGNNTDKQYRFKRNIKELSQTIDTTQIRTRIKAYGANGLETFYTSPLATNPLFGVLDAEPITDESITNMGELLEFAKTSLNDTPEINIDVSVLDTDGNVGDFVWVIHEEMNLEHQSRILSKRTKRDYQESTVEIGNTKKRTIEDAIIDQKEEIEQNKEDIAETNENLNETAENIRVEISQTANSIRLEVEDVDRSVASLEIKADMIQSNVTNLENYTTSSITQLSDNINLKVDKGGTITDINLSPGVATINAEKINLNGAVMVNGSISGSTDIIVSNSVAVGNALYFGGFRGSVDFIEVSGGDMSFNSFGDFMFSGGSLYVNGKRVLTE